MAEEKILLSFRTPPISNLFEIGSEMSKSAIADLECGDPEIQINKNNGRDYWIPGSALPQNDN